MTTINIPLSTIVSKEFFTELSCHDATKIYLKDNFDVDTKVTLKEYILKVLQDYTLSNKWYYLSGIIDRIAPDSEIADYLLDAGYAWVLFAYEKRVNNKCFTKHIQSILLNGCNRILMNTSLTDLLAKDSRITALQAYEIYIYASLNKDTSLKMKLIKNETIKNYTTVINLMKKDSVKKVRDFSNSL